MAKTDYKSVDHYLAAQPEAVRETLQTVRGAIRTALPGAEEVISYQIPAYKVPGGYALYFSGWKQHYSLYPVSDRVRAVLEGNRAPHEVEKGTLRFPLTAPVPVKLIGRVAKARAQDVAEQAKAKADAKAKTKTAKAKAR
jgi:uncharacterized protein YdhG (YjbR/CyaY superfamily)